MFEKYIYQSLCLIVLGCVPVITQAGDYKVFGNHYAWNNNFNDKQNALTASFGTGNSASMTAYTNTTYQQLWGYPAICRGYHYGFNPASNDYLFPKKISKLKRYRRISDIRNPVAECRGISPTIFFYAKIIRNQHRNLKL